MPNPRSNETEREFVNRCIPILIDEGKPSDQAAAICYEMFDSATSKEMTKRVGDENLPFRAFLVVEDPEKVTTWHLPVKKFDGGELVPDTRRMGAAWAALHGGYRGNKYEGPNKQDAISKLKKMYKSLDMDTPKSKEFENTLKEFTGAMVGMFLPLPAAVALDVAARDLPFYVDRTKARDYHLTLAYLGDLQNDVLPVDDIRSAVENFAVSHPVITGRFGGIGRMSKSNNGKNAVYANFDSPELPQFRQDLVTSLQSVGVFQDPEHGFIPHVTLGYMPDNIEEIPHLELPEIDFTFDKITLALGGERIDFDLQSDDTEKSTDGFSVVVDKSGAYRWVAISSTAYQDKESQIVSRKALKQAVEINDARGYHGPLRWWHMGGYDKDTLKATSGLDVGDCDFSWARGKFLVESGTFRKPEYAEKLKGFDGQVSIRFLHPKNEPDNEGVFENIVIFERSLLPRGRASNPFTSFIISKEKTPMQEKAKEFVKLLGDSAFAESVVAELDIQQERLDPKVKSKEDNGLLSRLKALIQKEEGTTQEIPPEETASDPVVSWVPTEESMKSIIGAAVAAAVTATQKTAVEEDTEQALRDAQKNLTDRIAKLESELTDAKKELDEIVGGPGYRASKDPDNNMRPAQKGEKNEQDRTGLTDFAARVSGQVTG